MGYKKNKCSRLVNAEGCNMASDTNNMLNNLNVFTKNDRIQMNKLRDCGLEYVSSSGKLIPAKTQPDICCHCPQQCQRKLSKTKWTKLFTQFYELADQNKQNSFLQTHIIIKAVHLHNWETKDKLNKRRVTCKYHIPDLGVDESLEQYIDKMADDTVEVCQKAFMNIFGITEKRIRMQRERCIALLAPDYYRKLPCDRNPINESRLEITPMDLSTDVSKESELDYDSEPLDLSNHSERSPSPIEVDKTKLYELADMLGVPRSTVDKEMVAKYEDLVRKNLAKQRKEMLKNKKKQEVPIKTAANLRGISEQVIGLGENLTILPIQTLNNGDLTITPVLGPASRPVENQEIMQVNNFFQNQLWRPEYIGLANKLGNSLPLK